VAELSEVRVPDLGEYKDVEIIDVSVKAGDTIALEGAVVTLETEKATLDVPSTAAGIVREVKVKRGDRVSQGDLLALVESTATGSTPEQPAAAQPAAPAAGSQVTPPQATKPPAAAAPSPPAAAPSTRAPVAPPAAARGFECRFCNIAHGARCSSSCSIAHGARCSSSRNIDHADR
jgi:pyruvate/2-oxoglutarate dehydrogenase complex dihydrolipoamide acyltransferase (E2) component